MAIFDGAREILDDDVLTARATPDTKQKQCTCVDRQGIPQFSGRAVDCVIRFETYDVEPIVGVATLDVSNPSHRILAKKDHQTAYCAESAILPSRGTAINGLKWVECW